MASPFLMRKSFIPVLHNQSKATPNRGLTCPGPGRRVRYWSWFFLHIFLQGILRTNLYKPLRDESVGICHAPEIFHLVIPPKNTLFRSVWQGQHHWKTLIQNHNWVILITTSFPSRGGMCYILDVGARVLVVCLRTGSTSSFFEKKRWFHGSGFHFRNC